jgi:psp operon transcriptional activator
LIQKEMSKNSDKQSVLSKAALISIRPYAQEVSYPAGTTIVHRNDKGSAFYLILSGQVEIILAEGDRRLPMSRLKEGSSFGEMSLFTQNPAFADVVTIADTKLLAISAENFQDALAASAPLRDHIFVRLCSNLHRESLEIWNLFQYTQALSSLMHIQDSNEPIICESHSMVHVKKRLDELGDLSLPVLITGETGTGKFFIAKKIHQHTAQQDTPLINLDCQQIDENQADKILFGDENTKEFLIRDSQQSSSNLLAKGALHLADKGSIILRHIDSLNISTQKTLLLYLETLKKLDNIFPRVRVLATTNKDLTLLVKEGLFDCKLAEQFADNVLEIPPLRKRKHDILPLAQLFAMADKSKSEGATPCFTESAEHKLLSGHYQHSNVVELREAVELASSFAEDAKIDAEHIFTGPKSHGASIECDVTQNNLIQRLIKKPSLWLLQGILLMVFSAIIILCITSSDLLVGRIANTMVWAV